MALDYQQILMEMNRPHRRQGMSFFRIAVTMAFLLALGGCGYAAWRFNFTDRAGETISRLWYAYAPSWMPGSERGGEMPAPALAVAEIVPDPGQDDSGELSLMVPGMQPVVSVNNAAVEERPAPRTAVADGLAPEPGRQPAVLPAPAERRAPVPSAAPAATPVLSDVKAQLRSIDELLRSDPAEAMERLSSLISTTRLQPDDDADAGYRYGYAARMAKDEDKAARVWAETVEKHPNTRGGRYSALALADSWFRQFAGERPQFSRWDDIQHMYSRVLGTDDAPFLPPDVKSAVKKNITRLNDGLFFGSAPSGMARYHKVEQGELLGSIASQYRVDYESLARINGIDPNRIRVGMDLKVVVGDVSIIVRKNGADPETGPTVTWFLDGRWVREYPACVGSGDKTPPGTYTLSSKERDPSWTNPANGQLLPNDHPENILGSRWMAMKGMDSQGLGIHGTTIDDSVPGYTSAGCVRLHNQDVEELFSFARVGSSVTVIE